MALPHRSTNYLRANRKRLGLSQDDVAFLLGCDSGAKVCRYEQMNREPNLKTALAFEVVFQRQPSELLPGAYQKIAKDVVKRAKALLRRIERQPPSRPRERKRQALENIINGSQNQPDKKA